MSGAAIACLSFLGFDSITTLASDTENPRRSIGKAMGVACAAAAVLFIFQTLASATIIPDFTRLSPSNAVFEIAAVAGGTTMQNLILLSTVLAAFGIGIAAITAASRMLRILLDEFSMNTRGAHSQSGGLLSEILPQTGTPPINVIICLAAAIAIAFIIPNRDFLLAFDLARFAGMICFMLVNAAALIFFWFKRHDPIYVRSIIIPAAGFLASLWIWINIEPRSFGIGVIFALVGVIIIAVSFLYDRLVLGIGPESGSESERDNVDAV
jgi:amino acid transporter